MIKLLNIRKNSNIDIGLSIFFIIMVFSFFILFINHYKLAIQKGEYYAKLSTYNSVTKTIIYAQRGLILDKDKKKLVINKISYDLYFIPQKISTDTILEKYPELKEKIDERSQDLEDLPNNVDHEILIAHKIPKDIAVKIKFDQIPGLIIKEANYRYYPYKDAISHVIGYTAIATKEDLERNPNLNLNDIVGRTGLEAYYDDRLRGVNGFIYSERDAFGRVRFEIPDSYVEPVNGDSLQLYLNLDWQRKMYKLLKYYVNKYHARSGSAVILDINTGGVIVLADYPSYDNNKFIGGISYKDFTKLVNDKRHPLLNHAIAAQEPAGSTFKTIVAAAALDSKAITPSTIFVSTGTIELPGGIKFQEYHKHSYGALNVRSALMVSSNIFFCKAMLKMGIDKFLIYAQNFGIGSKTGIDLPGEAPGRLPSPENKIWLAKHGAYWLDPVWYPEGDSCNAAIGQGITLVTPIQMASVASTIANGGIVYKPTLVKTIIKPDGSKIENQPIIKAHDFVSDSSLKVVREGMRLTVVGDRAIAWRLKDAPVKVAAKTGTAEFGKKGPDGYYLTHAWIIGFYPYDHPKYAFAVLLESGGSSAAAVSLMKDFLLEVY